MLPCLLVLHPNFVFEVNPLAAICYYVKFEGQQYVVVVTGSGQAITYSSLVRETHLNPVITA